VLRLFVGCPARGSDCVVFPVAGLCVRRARQSGWDEASSGIVQYWFNGSLFDSFWNLLRIHYSVFRDSEKELCCPNGCGTISLWGHASTSDSVSGRIKINL